MCSLLAGQELLGVTHNMKIVSLTQFSDYNSKISNFRFIDIDKDPKKEIFLCNNYGREIQLFDDDFTKILSIPNEDLGGLVKAHTIKSNYKENYIYIEGDKKTQLIKYYKNKDYFLSFLIPSFITILFYFIIYFALKQREKAIKQKHQQEKDLIEAQLKIANKQMSPHFQLNVLNAVSYLFDKDKDKAQYYMGKYARLVTHIMMNVDKINTSLSNEISFTTNYLSLEQLRLEYKFDFEVHIDEQVDKHLIIPRMLIFTFCENAVKHGLFHKESKGSLTVDIKKLDGSIVLIQIEDNGIGRNKAKSLNTGGTGMGLKTLNKIIKFYNSVNKSIINYQIEDITDKEGTRVTVTIKRKGEE
jgi:LytS/YehU family sensor histidine kinase